MSIPLYEYTTCSLFSYTFLYLSHICINVSSEIEVIVLCNLCPFYNLINLANILFNWLPFKMTHWINQHSKTTPPIPHLNQLSCMLIKSPLFTLFLAVWLHTLNITDWWNIIIMYHLWLSWIQSTDYKSVELEVVADELWV